MKSDSIRRLIKDAVRANDRKLLINLFRESINSFGFSIINDYSWTNGECVDKRTGDTYKFSEKELANTALKLRGEKE